MNNSTNEAKIPALLQALIQLLEAHRPAFKQSRSYLRSIGLALAELFTFGRHTVSQSIFTPNLSSLAQV